MSEGFPRHPTPFAVLLGAVFALPIAIFGGCVAWSAADRIEILWDEPVDLEIAEGLRSAPLRGGDPLDPSQTRLPMMANAMAASIFGMDGITGSRHLSAVVGAVTILIAAVLAAILFDAWTAVLAALLLSLSPYFLSFARIGMTEGDIFAACFCTLALLSYVWYLKAPNAIRWVVAGVALALAIGAKFFALFLIPVFAFLSATTYSEPRITFKRDPNDVKRVRWWLLVQWALVALTYLLALIGGSARNAGDAVEAGWLARYCGVAATIGWILLLLVWMGTVIFTVGFGVIASARATRFRHLMLFAGVSVFVLMPVHLLEPEIAKSLLLRTVRWDGRAPLALWADHLRLYSGIVLLKATIPVGVVTVLAIVNAMVSERTEGRWRPCLFAVLFYIPVLCFLPLRQTFYLMPVYPCLMILAAAMTVGTTRWSFSLGPGYGIFACALVAVGLGNLMMESRAAYPDYHLYGYATVGDRWLGDDSRGYRNLIQTPSDGVVSLIRWCETPGNVRDGDRVLSYLWEDRIVRDYLGPDLPEDFVLRGVTEASDTVPPPLSIADADYVLLHINNLLGYGDRPPDHPDMELLSKHFEKVFTVVRGGSARPLEVAWVYRRIR